jgi:hypothetical protein
VDVGNSLMGGTRAGRAGTSFRVKDLSGEHSREFALKRMTPRRAGAGELSGRRSGDQVNKIGRPRSRHAAASAPSSLSASLNSEAKSSPEGTSYS